MENFPLRGITLIEESPSISATPLALSTLKRLQSVSYEIIALALLTDEKELRELFDDISLTSIHIISIDIPNFNLIKDKLDAHLTSSISTDKRLVYIPSADILLRFLGVDHICRLLYSLSQNHLIITRVFYDAWNELELSRLHSVCTNILRIYIDQNKTCVCKTRVEKKDGLYGKTTEQFSIDPTTLLVKSQAYQAPLKYQVVVESGKEEPKSSKDILPKTTFDMGLNLSEEERRAKTETRLPYTHAQNEQGLVSLNITSGRKIRAAGQIIYTPDANDDLEDSDPDDDLMV